MERGKERKALRLLNWIDKHTNSANVSTNRFAENLQRYDHILPKCQNAQREAIVEVFDTIELPLG